MTREEAREFLIDISSKLGNMSAEYLSEKDGEKMRESIKVLEQESNTWNLDDAREDFMSDVYNTLDFLPTNNEANRIIDSFDRVTSGIKQESILDQIRAEIEQLPTSLEYPDIEYIYGVTKKQLLEIIDKYKTES